jgi:Fe-S-cluster containining protein
LPSHKEALADMSVVVLRTHSQKHLPVLEVNPNLFEARYAAACDTRSCKAVCCADGTTVDVVERDRILAHAEMVKQSMSPGQDTDPAHWFEATEKEDRDFASGRAAYTTANENGCVFLDVDKLCVLQRASEASGGAVKLKPIFCAAFPVVIDQGVLGVDPLSSETGSSACCAHDPAGPLTVFDVCAMELELVVGAEGVEELRRLQK